MTEEHRRVISEMLSRTQLFRSLAAEQIAPLVAAATLLQFDPSEPLFWQGEPAEAFFLMVGGQAAFQAIREGEAIEIGRVGPAELLGTVGVILKEPHNGTVVARDPVIALRFDAARFWQMFQQLPGFAT